jgi:hypothetical protein
MQMIQVASQAIGWSVSGVGETQFFTSGASAEQAARRLAEALARAGSSVELLIADRSGRLAGRLRLGVGRQAAASSLVGSTA